MLPCQQWKMSLMRPAILVPSTPRLQSHDAVPSPSPMHPLPLLELPRRLRRGRRPYPYRTGRRTSTSREVGASRQLPAAGKSSSLPSPLFSFVRFLLLLVLLVSFRPPPPPPLPPPPPPHDPSPATKSTSRSGFATTRGGGPDGRRGGVSGQDGDGEAIQILGERAEAKNPSSSQCSETF